jgi:hypothetical protein
MASCPAFALAEGDAQQSFLPPSFNTNTAQVKSIFSSCMGITQDRSLEAGLKQGLSIAGDIASDIANDDPLSIGASIPAGPISINTPCDPVGGVTDEFTCSLLGGSESGGTNPATVAKYKAEQRKAMGALECRKSKMSAIEQELKCLTNAASQLAQEVGKMQQAMMTNIQKFQKDVAEIKSVQADRAAQMEDVQEKLAGGPGGVPKGIEQLKNEMQAALTASYGEYQQTQEQRIDIANSEKELEEQTQILIVTRARECFTTQTQAGLRCDDSSDPASKTRAVSLKDYILCRYREVHRTIGTTGVFDPSASTKANATNKASELEDLLGKVMGDAPAQTAAQPGAPQAPPEVSVKVMGFADIDPKLWDNLKAFNGNGLDVASFIKHKVGACYRSADKLAKREKKMAGTNLGKLAASLQSKKRDSQKNMSALLDRWAQQYSEAMRGLTGMNLPIDISACRRGPPIELEGCLSNMQKNMEGMLKGTSENSGVQMLIKGNNPSTNIGFSCSGLNGCAASLHNLRTNLQTSMKQIEAQKQKYIQSANQNVQSFVSQMASVMSPYSQMITNQLKSINTALASMGIKAKVPLSTLPGEELKPDADGLLLPPENVLQAVSSKMNPKLLDLDGENFGTSMEGLSEGSASISDELKSINKAKIALDTQVAQCAGEKVQKAQDKLRSFIEEKLANCEGML